MTGRGGQRKRCNLLLMWERSDGFAAEMLGFASLYPTYRDRAGRLTAGLPTGGKEVCRETAYLNQGCVRAVARTPVRNHAKTGQRVTLRPDTAPALLPGEPTRRRQ